LCLGLQKQLYFVLQFLFSFLNSPHLILFVTIILNSIDTVKKTIPRCTEAFDKIVESVDILKNNFNGYYKDFMASNNPAIIMENFVLDVSKNTKATPRITSQFRRIIAHYRKIASRHIDDPRLQTLFQHVDRNINELDKYKKDDDTYEDDENKSDEEDDENKNEDNDENKNKNEDKDEVENKNEDKDESSTKV